jgi:hypothetical protein
LGVLATSDVLIAISPRPIAALKIGITTVGFTGDGDARWRNIAIIVFRAASRL